MYDPIVISQDPDIGARELIFYASLAANRSAEGQDAIDFCITQDAYARGLKPSLESHSEIDFIPFDPVLKRVEVVVEGTGCCDTLLGNGNGTMRRSSVISSRSSGRNSISNSNNNNGSGSDNFSDSNSDIQSEVTCFRAVKGAPQVVLRMAHNNTDICDEVEEAIMDLANRGYRSLGVARTLPGYSGLGTEHEVRYRIDR